MTIHVIGGGLAGSEATWQLVQRGIPVTLHEMRPKKESPAHKTEYFGELVCRNSLRANNIENAVGLFISTLPVYTNLSKFNSLKDLLKARRSKNKCCLQKWQYLGCFVCVFVVCL